MLSPSVPISLLSPAQSLTQLLRESGSGLRRMDWVPAQKLQLNSGFGTCSSQPDSLLDLALFPAETARPGAKPVFSLPRGAGRLFEPSVSSISFTVDSEPTGCLHGLWLLPDGVSIPVCLGSLVLVLPTLLCVHYCKALSSEQRDLGWGYLPMARASLHL